MLESQNDFDFDEIRQGFEMFDVDKTGFISPLELLETFDAMNLKQKNPFIYNIIHSLTKSKKHASKISIDELISFIDSKLNSNTKKGINLIYDSLCEPNNNSLSLSSLPQILRESDDIISEKELRSLIQKAEMGGEEIDFEEFLKIMTEGKNLEEDDLDEKDSSDKENRDDNIESNNGGIIYEKKDSYKNNGKVYNVNSNNSNNSSNRIYSKKSSSKGIQNNEILIKRLMRK